MNSAQLPATVTECVTVDLGGRSYPILIGHSWLGTLGHTLRRQGVNHADAMVVTDPTVGGLYYATMLTSLTEAGFARVVRHDVPAGEENKNWGEFGRCCDALLKAFSQSAAEPLLINLGGGVIGDLGGFAAGVFRRGVSCVHVPTTLLSCVDSSVGGKVGVNHGGVKNIMGMFKQPKLVFIDLAVLQTLPAREVRSGVAEVIKYGAICDAELFTVLEENIEALLALEPGRLQQVVHRCCQLKGEIVRQDEFDEKGIRNALNFGHTIGHALEMAAEGELTHGEAISIGMVAATQIAVRLGKCHEAFARRLVSLLQRAGLPIAFTNSRIRCDDIVTIMQADKKFRAGKNCFVLPLRPGEGTQVKGVSAALINEVVSSCLAA